MNSFWMPKKQPLYMPMLSTFGGGSVQGLRGGPVFPTTFTLDNFGATGAIGPESSAVPLENVTVYDPGYIEFVIPAGTYTFQVEGAAGGAIPDGTLNKPTTSTKSVSGSGGTRQRLTGALLTGQYTFTQGTTLLCVVGQGGFDGDSTNGNVGGGGGTFVAIGTYENISIADPLIIAGGGGGLGGDDGNAAADTNSLGVGQASQQAGSINTSALNDGTNPTTNWGGSGPAPVTNSSGGASWSTSSSDPTNAFSSFSRSVGADVELDAYACGFLLGARGAYNNGFYGGFGGGGRASAESSSDDDKGGGGGWSGGSHGFDAHSCGGGGSSYTRGGFTSVSATAGGSDRYHGRITIISV